VSEWTPGVSPGRFKEEAVLAHVVRSPPTIELGYELSTGIQDC
jgi:hypothetical protein